MDGVRRTPAETRGETAERAVAPLVMEGVCDGEVGWRFEGGGFGETVAMLEGEVAGSEGVESGCHAFTLSIMTIMLLS